MAEPALIFDLDDTLIESFPTYAELHQRVARELGWRVPEHSELVAYAQTWEATLAALWPESDLECFMRRYDMLADAHPYPAVSGVTTMLEQLSARGSTMFIVTKRSRRRLAHRLAQAEIEPSWFAGIFAFEDQPASKPDPRCFDPVWAALGRRLQGDEAVYLGDRHEDQRAANAAGIHFLGVRTGPEYGRVFPQPGSACELLDSAAELGAWLGQRAGAKALRQRG